VVERLQRADGVFLQRHTHTCHPVAAAAALAVLQTIERDDLLAQVQKRGATLRRMLGDVFARHPHVGDIRGRGLFQALELVHDRVTREPFAPERRLHAAIKRQAMQRGLMVYPMGGTIDGRRCDHVLLAPPFIVSAAQLSEIVARLEEAVNAAIKEVL
jgi:adenosylmethionine-8-amino-7-oxononanoate aminotransferase